MGLASFGYFVSVLLDVPILSLSFILFIPGLFVLAKERDKISLEEGKETRMIASGLLLLLLFCTVFMSLGYFYGFWSEA